MSEINGQTYIGQEGDGALPLTEQKYTVRVVAQ